ncbi:hypothetical protein C8T65DRAFT_699021 [Cerioporus squamosus]|nr:hypothetical protein C8T65DRAFT_699021 [Cerioporus squamosus]
MHERQSAIREQRPSDSEPLPALLDSDEVQEWLAAKQGFRNAALSMICDENGLVLTSAVQPSPGTRRDVSQEQHSKAALKFHMATLRVLEVYRDATFWTKVPTEDVTSLSPDAAMTRMLALEMNERRLVLEYEAAVALILCVQSEAASLSHAYASDYLPSH